MITTKAKAIVTVTLMVAVVAITLATNLVPLRQILDQQAQVAAARAELQRLSEENGVLTSEVEALQSPGEVERLAREKLGYVREGETAYIVLPPEEHAIVPVRDDGAVTERPWWATVWDFISGRDVLEGS